ncbi:MAG: hypothetical protein HRU15_11770 [Planctomycetes bacterium]|nr:hypothetical protein [Planctomycetota bacterium]
MSTAVCCTLTPSLWSQDDFTTWFKPKVRSYSFLDSQIAYSPASDTSDTGEDLAWMQAKILGLKSFYHSSTFDVAGWASYQDVSLDSNAQLSLGTDVPDHLRSLRIGLTGRMVSEQWLAGISIMGQGNGDGPVGDNEQGEQVTAFGQYRFDNSSNGKNMWGIWGFFQHEGLVQDDMVIGGGVSYKSDSLTLLLGFPWAKAEWFVHEDFLLKAIYYGGPWYADATWFWAEKWRSGVGIQERNDGFYRRQRTVDFHQFQIRQRQADVFITHELPGYKYLSLRAGFVFDRIAFEDKPYEDDGLNRLELDTAPITELTFSWWF